MYTIEIQKDLEQILGKILKNDSLTFTPQTQARDVKGWDSLTNMLFISQIEKHYGIHFNFREIIHIANVGDLCNVILNKLG